MKAETSGRLSGHREQPGADAKSRNWVTPRIEDLGSVTEITLVNSSSGIDYRNRGCFCCGTI